MPTFAERAQARGETSMTEPIDRIVTAVAAAQAVLADCTETGKDRSSARSAIVRLRNILEDHELASAMLALGHTPPQRVASLRVIQGGVADNDA
jgi:hypothetical protein